MTAVMRLHETVKLRMGVYSAVTPDDELLLVRGDRRDSLGRAEKWKHALLRGLATSPTVVAELVERFADPAAATALVSDLQTAGWLETTVIHEGEDLYTLRPMKRALATSATGSEPLVLSRFAVLHRDRAGLVLESPLASADLIVHHPGVVAAMAPLATGQEDAGTAEVLAPGVKARLWDDLRTTGLAVPADDEDSKLATAQWWAHDLWLHDRSRVGDHATVGVGFGRTAWARSRFEPLPARRAPYPGPTVELRRPDLDSLHRTDIPLVTAVENRRSRAVHDDARPINAAQLAELMYRCVRVRRMWTVEGIQYVDRPHPSGGGMYELEVYPVVRRVQGLAAGMYHYDAHEHQLRLVKAADRQVRELLISAARSTPRQTPPQVLLVITARFGRLMWFYEQMGYSLIMKNTGALYQTLYLTATSMGLAACGLGGGSTRLFNEATGVPYTEEAAVGEFIVGSTLEEPV